MKVYIASRGRVNLNTDGPDYSYVSGVFQELESAIFNATEGENEEDWDISISNDYTEHYMDNRR